MIAALKKTNKSNSKKRVEGRKAVSSREYDSLHFYDHTSTCIPFVNFVFYSCLKIWGGCSFNKTTYVQTQSKDFHLFSSTKLLLRYLIISTCYRLRLNLHKYQVHIQLKLIGSLNYRGSLGNDVFGQQKSTAQKESTRFEFSASLV